MVCEDFVNLRPLATTALVIISLYCDMLANPPHTVSIHPMRVKSLVCVEFFISENCCNV